MLDPSPSSSTERNHDHTPIEILNRQLRETPLAAHAQGRARTDVRVRHATIGASTFSLIAGPCAVESEEQIETIAACVAQSGGKMLRGGVFKPRTSPYSFQGEGAQGLVWLRRAARAHDLAVVTEVLSEKQVDLVHEYADMLQIGARNMQNYALLREVAQTRLPVLLKRGPSATLDEFLHAAEYLLAGGNTNVVLCERGIRTFESAMRYTLDLGAVVALRERTHLPILVDPSHAAGARRFVPALARAARAIGADGVIVEIHPDPDRARSDGPQSLTLESWRNLARELQS
jgi:3-deoxy-7-phosphoheptulonate synthase